MGTHALSLEGNPTMELEAKRIRVSAKRQITIPQKFFEKLGIGSEVECFVRGGELVIRPVPTNEFAEEILQDLIQQGFEGRELLEEFRRVRAQIRPAVVRMIEEADHIAQNSKGSGDEKTRDIFGDILED